LEAISHHVVILRCVEVGWHLITLGNNNIKELFFQALIETRQKLCQMFPGFNIFRNHLYLGGYRGHPKVLKFTKFVGYDIRRLCSKKITDRCPRRPAPHNSLRD
jgi:hypothetical protein